MIKYSDFHVCPQRKGLGSLGQTKWTSVRSLSVLPLELALQKNRFSVVKTFHLSSKHLDMKRNKQPSNPIPDSSTHDAFMYYKIANFLL